MTQTITRVPGARSIAAAVLALLASAQVPAAAQPCPQWDKVKVASTLGLSPSLQALLKFEVPSCEHLELGRGGVGLVLTGQNTLLHNGVRSELAFDHPFVEGDTVEYRWSVLFPSSNGPGGRADQWWLIAQWHDQPDPIKGETWAHFRSQSPPVALHVERHGGVLGMGLSTVNGRKLSWAPVPLDQWLDVTARIHWSQRPDGQVLVEVAGQPALRFTATGPNMLNNYQHYFKMGQYRAPSVTGSSVVYFKDLRISTLSK